MRTFGSAVVFRFITVFALISCPAIAQMSVVSAANYSAAVAPGSIAAVFGSGLTNQQDAATTGSNGALPTVVDSTSVSVNGEAASLFFVSPGQINFLVPADIPVGAANITVTSPSGTQSGSMQIQLVSPGIFTIPCLRVDRGAAENAITAALEPFTVATSQNPGADKRTYLSLYGTGFRWAGNPARNPSMNNMSGLVTAQLTDINGNVYSAQVTYAGAQPTMSGLDQINLVLPPALPPTGIVTIALNVAGQNSNPVSIAMSTVPESAEDAGFTISTAAGSGTAGMPGNAGPAILSQLNTPLAVAFDTAHNMYIADAGNHVVRRVDPTGLITVYAGTGTAGSSGDGGSATAAQLQRPVALATDSQGSLYIADSTDNRIRKVSSSGVITTAAGTGAAGFGGDNALATSAVLNAPGGIAINSAGTIIVADTGNNRVRRITADGYMSTLSGAGSAAPGSGAGAYASALNAPTDVAVDPSGTIFVADSGNYLIRRIPNDLSIFTIGGTGTKGASGTNCPATQASFGSPVRLATDATGHLIISDTSNQKIRLIDSNCYINDIAGTGTAGFSGGGGTAAQAQLNMPGGVAVDQTGNIYVADSSNQRIRTLSVATGAGIAFAPSPAASGQTVTAYVNLGGTPATQPETFQITSSVPIADLPSSVTIPAGQVVGVVTLTAPAVTSPAPVTFTVSGSGISGSGSLTVVPAASTSGSASSPSVASLTISPAQVSAGGNATGSVTLGSPAPAGGTEVILTSNSTAAAVAPSLLIPQGQTKGEFLIAVPSSAGSATVTVGASIEGAAAGSGESATLAVTAGGGSPSLPGTGTIGGFTLTPQTIVGGQTGTGTVSLASPAGTGGVAVSLSSNNPAVTVPATATVPQGSAIATFPISTTAVTTPATATITATSANSLSGTVTVTPAPAGAQVTLGGVSFNPSSISGGSSATGTISLPSSAPAGGAAVTLSSSNPAVMVPASVTIPQGSVSATFPITTAAVTTPTTATITATSANTVSGPVTVTPATGGAQVTLGGLSFSPSSVTGGNSVTGTVSLPTPAPAGGAAVALSSSTAGVSVPSSFTIPAGQSSGSFQVQTQPVSSTVNGSVSATSLNTVTAPLTITAPASPAPGVASVTISPNTVTGGQSATGTVNLATPAPAGGASVQLSSNSSAATVNPSVQIAQGQTSATFPVTTTPVSNGATATVTATSGTTSGTATMMVNAPCVSALSLQSTVTNALTGGGLLTGTVNLSGAAPTGGTTVNLTSGGASLGTAVVPQGQSSGSINLNLANLAQLAGSNVTAQAGACNGVSATI